ncbi:MAG: hypothetical protein ACK5RC_08490 [Curvibacter sp.]
MRKLLCLLVLALPVLSAQAHDAKAIAKDVQRHRAMAAAHEAAARCLESGKKFEVCQKELQAACKGLALGKYCGMRHEH